MHVSMHLANHNLLKPVRQLRLPDANTTAFAVGGGRLASTVVMVTLRLLDIGDRKMPNPDEVVAEILRLPVMVRFLPVRG